MTTEKTFPEKDLENESEDTYVISVTFEKFTHDDLEAGEASERGVDIERETVDKDTLERYAQDYGISEASSSQSSEHVWFNSTSPREDKAYFESGVHQYFGLHVHEINGEKPTAEDMQQVAEVIGVRFDQPLADHSLDANRVKG